MSLSFFFWGSVLSLFINEQYDFVTGRKETPDIIDGKQLHINGKDQDKPLIHDLSVHGPGYPDRTLLW